jgi:hypothetical protein
MIGPAREPRRQIHRYGRDVAEVARERQETLDVRPVGDEAE